MRPVVLRFGLLAGFILSAALVVLAPLHDRLGYTHAEWIGYASMVAAFLLVFAAVRAYRDGVAGGAVSFGRALAVGTLVVAVASACYTATWEVLYFSAYRGTFAARYQAHEVETLRARGASEAAIAARTAELRRFAALYDNPVANAAITFLEPLPVGLLAAVAAAGLLRRRRTLGDEPALPVAAGAG